MTLRRRSYLALSGTVLAGVAGCLTTADGGSGVPDDGDTDGDIGGDSDDGTGGDSVETVEPDWTYDTGGGVATVADGVVYGIEAIGDGTGGVLALDTATGDREWVYGKTGGYSAYTPPVVRGSVYVGLGDDAIGSGNGDVTALARDGSEQWVTETGSVYEQPVAVGDALYVGSDDGSVYRLDAATGEVVWSCDVGGGPDGPPDPSVAAVDGGTVYVTLAERMLGLDAETGDNDLLVRPGESDIRSVRVDDDVYVGTPDRVVALDGDGVDWTSERGAGYVGRVRDGFVYVTDGRRLAALGADSGRERWHVETAQRHVARVGPEAVYLGAEAVRAVGPDGGTRWRTALDGSSVETLTVVEDGVVASTDAGVFRLDAVGAVVAEARIGSVGSVVVGDAVYAASSDRVVALDL